MSEEQSTPPEAMPSNPIVPESDEVFIQQDLDLVNTLSTRSSSESAQRLMAEPAPSTPVETKEDLGFMGTGFTGKQIVGAGLLATAAVTGVSVLSSQRMDTTLENTANNPQPVDFANLENGLGPNQSIDFPEEVTETHLDPQPTVSPTEIPSPTPRMVDVQLPTLSDK